MPDNVSLTVSEINSLKQTGNTLLSRLKTTPFVFSNDSTGKSKQTLSLIADGSTPGMKVYAGSDTLKISKNAGNVIDFTLGTAKGTPQNPCILVTLSSSKDLSLYRFSYSAVYDSSTGKVKVHISASPDNKHKLSSKKSVDVRVNLLVISYG